ncbi:hypothetical protein KR215_009778, partial [Drosophila sulfurigaster]
SRAGVLNEVSSLYTFDNHRGRSDIDVTIANEAALMWATYDWRVDEWDLSDHNTVCVEVARDPRDTVESDAPVPSWNFSNARWQSFRGELVCKLDPQDYTEMSIDDQVSATRALVHSLLDSGSIWTQAAESRSESGLVECQPQYEAPRGQETEAAD